MIIYFQSINFNLWLSIQNRSPRPIKIKNGIEISKIRCEYTGHDKKLFFMDVKAMNILYYTLGKSEFDRIILYKNA
jgi:hypothetical protein